MRRPLPLLVAALCVLAAAWWLLRPAPRHVDAKARTWLVQAERLCGFRPALPNTVSLGLQLVQVQANLAKRGFYQWSDAAPGRPLPVHQALLNDPVGGYDLQLVFRDGAGRSLWLFEGPEHHDLPGAKTILLANRTAWYAEIPQGGQTLRLLRWRNSKLEFTLMSSSLTRAQLEALAQSIR